MCIRFVCQHNCVNLEPKSKASNRAATTFFIVVTPNCGELGVHSSVGRLIVITVDKSMCLMIKYIDNYPSLNQLI